MLKISAQPQHLRVSGSPIGMGSGMSLKPGAQTLMATTGYQSQLTLYPPDTGKPLGFFGPQPKPEPTLAELMARITELEQRIEKLEQNK